jgi:glycerate kinase
MKKIVIAADSFKGSVSSKQVAESIEKGIIRVFPQCDVIKTYIADGGEGTVEALVETMKGQYVSLTVHDPLMRPIEARYGIIENGKTAVIEMAAASGLPLLALGERNPMKTSTWGTGEMIKDALLRGCRCFLIGIGGSATNDAGTGMLQALGFRFPDKDGKELGGGGEILSRIEKIDFSSVLPELTGTEFIVACDVTNPFCGLNGAAYIFAPQKGADLAMVEELDKGLFHFSSVMKDFTGTDITDFPGAGAAGGLGGGLKALFNAALVSGILLVLDAIHFRNLIKDADMIITGEGKLDKQTAMGKAPRGVLDIAQEYNIPVIAIGGSIEAVEKLNEEGFTAVFSILPEPVTLEKAMQTDYAEANIERTISQIMRVIKNI